MTRDYQNSAMFKMEMQMRGELQAQLQHCVAHYEEKLAEKTRLVNEMIKRNKELMARIAELSANT
jgi:hypothetical protein